MTVGCVLNDYSRDSAWCLCVMSVLWCEGQSVCVCVCVSDGYSGHLLLVTQSCRGRSSIFGSGANDIHESVWGDRVFSLCMTSQLREEKSDKKKVWWRSEEPLVGNLCVVHCKFPDVLQIGLFFFKTCTWIHWVCFLSSAVGRATGRAWLWRPAPPPHCRDLTHLCMDTQVTHTHVCTASDTWNYMNFTLCSVLEVCQTTLMCSMSVIPITDSTLTIYNDTKIVIW